MRPARRTGRLAGRAGAVLAGLACAGLLLLAASRTWVGADLPAGPAGGAGGALAVSGGDATPLVRALALVGLAAAAALSTVRGAGRAVTGLLLALAGVAAVLATTAVLLDPAAAAAPAVRSATGLSSATASGAAATAWPALALLPAAGLAAVGLVVLVRGRHWATTARFEAPAAAGGDAAAPGPTTGRTTAPATGRTAGPAPSPRPASRAALWDDLSRGDDPTTGPGGS